VSGTGVALALLGLLGALGMPALPAADATLRARWNPLAETADVLRLAAGQRGIWLCILGLSWFWTVGATLLTEFPIIARDTLHGDGGVMTLLLAVFAIGVGAGSVGCARLLHGEVSPRFVPFAALAISLFCWDFSRAAEAAGTLENVLAVAGSWHGWRIGVDFGEGLGQEIFCGDRRFAHNVKLRFEKSNDVAQRLIHIKFGEHRRRHF